MRYFIGIDGGGTKTAFLCVDAHGTVVGETTCSTVHVMQVCDEEAVRVLKQGIHAVLPEAAAGQELFICAGFGGYGKHAGMRKRIEDICAASFGDLNASVQVSIKSDAEIALYGALNGADGILVIAGTGAIGFAKVEQQLKRCGGWGYLLGDEGSAYWMGKELLEVFCRQSDGRLEKTRLHDLVCAHFGIKDSYELIPLITQTHDRTTIASLAKLVFTLAQQREPAALEIYDRAARHLADIVHVLAKNYPDGCSVSYAGGVWNAGTYIFAPFARYLDEKLTLAAPAHPPVYGAYLLAKKMSGEEKLGACKEKEKGC